MIQREKESKMVTTKELHKIQLVDGEFTPSQAGSLLNSLIDQKIAYHKIQKWSVWEGNHNMDPRRSDDRIRELDIQKMLAKDIIDEARTQGCKIEIGGTLEIKFVK